MTQRHRESTHEVLLDAAVAMVFEHGAVAGVGNVKLVDVVRRAKLTTGAAYRIWPDQSAFHRDLAAAVAGWRDSQLLTRPVSAIRAAVESGADWRTVVRVGAADHLASLAEPFGGPEGNVGPSPFLTALAVRSATNQCAQARSAASRRHDDSIASFADLYGGLLVWSHRKMREPFQIGHLARAIAALAEGFAIHLNVGDSGHMVGPADGEPVRLLFAEAIIAMVEAFTEPLECCPVTR